MWVERLQNEFFAQGDKEREAGLDVSPLMDRRKSGTVASSQVSGGVHVGRHALG